MTPLIALVVTKQIVWGGFVDGLSIGLLALGVVLVHRSSGVINFAVGAIGAFSAALLALLVVQYHWAFWLAVVAAILAGAAFAAVVEATVITRLFRSPRVIVLVATIGIAELATAAQTALPELDDASISTRYPTAITGESEVLGVRVRGAELAVLIAVFVLTGLLSWFLARTDLGKAVRAAAANPERARLSGVNPKVLSTIVWTIAGGLSAVSLCLLAGTSGSVVGLSSIGSSTLARVLVAALIGRMASFPRALAGGVVIGIVEAVVRYNAPTQVGLTDALLLVVVVVATWSISRHTTASGDDAFAFAPRTRPVPERLRALWWVRRLPWITGTLGLAAAAILPFLVTAPSRHFLYSRVLLFALLALSLVVLTGWAGQVSLGQAAFAGIGALGYAALVNGNDLGLGYGTHRIVLALPKLPPGGALVVMTVVCAAVAALLGAGALRVRGLLLGVVTFVFALASQQWLWHRPFFAGDGSGSVFVRRPVMGAVNLTGQRAFYFVALGLLAVAMLLVARLRRSGIGRAMIGVRDNPDSAAAFTVSPAHTKLAAFATAGAIAGCAGALLGALLSTMTLSEVFTVGDSLQVVAVAVIGGVGSVAGPALGAAWVIGLPAFWPNNELVPLLTSSLGLLILLMYFPGGLVQIAQSGRDALLRWVERRLPEVPPVEKSVAVPVARQRADRGAAPEDALRAADITVRFGGRVAVDHATIRVGSGEVVGLIGTNGAGKSTLMNAIGGFVDASGEVELLGRSVAGRRPEHRARVGLGRTFQAARLFPDLTVRETLQVALEARHRTTFTSAALALPKARRVERAQRSDAEEILHFLGLGRYADRYIAELSTGTRRIVELATLLALDARVLCLDEPTAGVAQRETEAFGPLLLRIRQELDASLLVIEHDMPLIMGISDRIYCLEAGKVIAEGAPRDVRADPLVIASYLGTDTRAIERSGSTGR